MQPCPHFHIKEYNRDVGTELFKDSHTSSIYGKKSTLFVCNYPQIDWWYVRALRVLDLCHNHVLFGKHLTQGTGNEARSHLIVCLQASKVIVRGKACIKDKIREKIGCLEGGRHSAVNFSSEITKGFTMIMLIFSMYFLKKVSSDFANSDSKTVRIIPFLESLSVRSV